MSLILPACIGSILSDSFLNVSDLELVFVSKHHRIELETVELPYNEHLYTADSSTKRTPLYNGQIVIV